MDVGRPQGPGVLGGGFSTGKVVGNEVTSRGIGITVEGWARERGFEGPGRGIGVAMTRFVDVLENRHIEIKAEGIPCMERRWRGSEW